MEKLDMLKCKAKVKWNGNHYFSGQCVYGYVFKKDLSDKAYIIDTEEDEFGNISFQEVEVDEDSVCRFTGQKDINDKEIYENDLVEITYSDYNGSYVQKVVVEWEYSDACFAPLSWKELCDKCDYTLNIDSIEVLGKEED